ncbi:hypothetical protein [Streptomyces sp. NPDC048142]|uniref:caspase, EACC1-associated type n=1 Tax=Streptomyces sp. NPDC048142 TaxID=3365501 RepID=UPI003722F109
MTDLSGEGARTLLIATSAHQDSVLPSVPSVARSYHDLQAALIERCGVRPDRLTAILDPPDAQTMAAAVTEAAQLADTVLLVYFIGHGLLGPDNELYLAASSTDRLTPGMAEHQALSFSTLKQAVGSSRASSIVVVLDCCFSGRVSLDAGPFSPTLSIGPAHGMHLLASAEQLAHAPEDAAHTAFTGAFIDLMTQGDPRGPHTLTLDTAYEAVFRKLRAQQHPLPRRQVGDRSGQLVIAPNPAFPAHASTPSTPTPEAPEPGRCPYPGLDAYGVDDAHVFFGRKQMTDRVLAAARASDDNPGPLILVGASGSGKTSLLNAGLLARLRENDLPASARWPCLHLTPGPSPFRNLARQLNGSAAALVDVLRDDPDRAADFVDHLLTDRPEQRLVLLVDQLEELFTLCPDPSEQTAFLRAVTAMARPPTDDGPPRALVILALRADFYAQAAAHPELLAVLGEAQLLVEPMTAEEMCDAIEKPAAAAGLTLDDKLADLILHELGASADRQSPVGALPLLSHVLRATWQEDGGTRLTVSGYLAAGGIRGAIAQTAERVYTEELDDDGRIALRTMLLRLVRVGQDAADTAQPVRRSALLSGLPKPEAAQRAIQALVKARLITLDHDTARISHEALLRAWPRLREWVDTDRAWLRDRRQLADDAAAWEQAGRDSSRLYRGNRLAVVRERAARAPGVAVLEPELAEFLDASWRQERRGTRRLRIALAIFIALAVLASAGLVGVAVFQRQAEQAHQRDLARYLAAETENLRDLQPGLAKQLSLLSYEIDREAGRGAMLNSQRTPGVINGDEPAHDIQYSANRRVLAIATGGSITLLAGGETGHISGVLAGPLTLNGDGTLLIAATYDNGQSPSATVRLWDIADLGHPRQIAALQVKPTITAVALSADGKTLFAGASTGEILRWGIDGRAAPAALPSLKAHSARVDSLAVSSRRDLLASMSLDGRIQLWNVADATRPERVGSLRGQAYEDYSLDHLRPLHRVAFDHSGRLLAAPLQKNTSEFELALWTLDNPGTPRRVGQTDENPAIPSNSCLDQLTSVTFSPTNPHIAGTCGSKWHVWAYDTSASPGTVLGGASFRGQDVESGMVLFDPGNARRLLQATTTGIHVWDLSNAAQPGARAYLPLVPGTASKLAYTQAGKRRLIAYQGPGWNYLWNVSNLKDPDLLTSNLAPDMLTANGIALSPDGGTLATVERFKKNKNDKDEYVGVRLRNTSTPDGPPLATIEEELTNGVQTLLFSPTAPVLVVSDFNGVVAANREKPTIRIFDISDPRHPRQISRIDTESFRLTFSPDGRTLVISESPAKQTKKPRPVSGPRLHGWDLTDPAHPAKLWTRQLPASTRTPDVVFRPDGALLAVSEGNGNLLLWRVERQRLIGRPVSVAVSTDGIDKLAFSPDGTHLALIATLEYLHRPEIWDLSDPGSPARQSYLPGTDSGGLYALRYSPDGETLAVVRAFAGVDLWDTDPERIVKNLCNAVGDPITREQWKRYLPDRPYRPPCH